MKKVETDCIRGSSNKLEKQRPGPETSFLEEEEAFLGSLEPAIYTIHISLPCLLI